jgi:hypothetical protein
MTLHESARYARPWNKKGIAMTRPFRSGPLIPAALLSAVWIFVITPSVFAGIDVPLFRSYFGIRMADTPGVGVTVAEVFANSPAAGADIKAGDRIISVEGKPVARLAEVSEIVISHPPYDTVEMVLERQGTRLAKKVTLSGRIRLEERAGVRGFPIPGVDTSDDPAVPGAVEALDRMNVLKRVLIDAKTNAVEFIGTYDPRYPTGPLPYRAFLDEAVRNPEPWFSLEPDPRFAEEYGVMAAKKGADIQAIAQRPREFFDWIHNWLNPITTHPLFENERQIYLTRYADAAGLTKGELVLLMNYVTVMGAKASVPADVLAVQTKLLRNLGFEKEAGLYSLYREGTSKSLAAAAKGLGKFEQAQKVLEPLVAAGRSEAQMLNALRAFLCSELIAAVDPFPTLSAAAYWRQFESGKSTFESLDVILQQKIYPERDRSGRSMVLTALDGMPFSNEMIRLVYGILPYRVNLEFKNVNPASHLARVLYEADYVGKTIDMSQQLFRTLPGHRTIGEMAAELPPGLAVEFMMTFVPGEIVLYASGDGAEVAFGESRIGMNSRTQVLPGTKAPSREESGMVEEKASAYARQFNDRYEEYAREYPPLHALREAAKILALAKWLAEKNVRIRTETAAAPDWIPPAQIPAIIDFTMKFTPEGTVNGSQKYVFSNQLRVHGGVNFTAQSNWVVLGPKPPSYTPVSDQLTTSAALGEQAVQAALGGNMESARELAELSARALTGDLDASRMPKGVILPKAAPKKPATPDEVRLVKEAVKAIRATAADPAGEASATSAVDRSAYLSQVGEALRTVQSDPASASNLLNRLQTRSFAPKTPGGSPISQPGDAREGGAPQSFDCDAYMSRFTNGAELADGRKAFLDGKIREIQDRLETVRKAMDELGRLRQGDLKALEKWQGEISRAYDDAQARALDAAAMLLVDGPLEILQKRRDSMKEAIDYGLTMTLLSKNAVLSADAVAGLDRTAFSLFRMKYLFEGIYGRAERLQKTLSGAKSLYDMSQWADSDQSDLEKIKSGTAQLVEMVINEPAVGDAIRLGKITGNTILRFLSLYKATDAAFGFFYDIMKLKFAWGPVVDELQRSLETNLRAVRTLQERSRDIQNQLNCVRANMK